MRPAIRLAVIATLLVVLGGLCVHYGAAYDDNWPHPTGDQIQDRGADAFVGDRVLLFGEVTAVDADAETVTIQVMDDSDEVAAELEIRGVEQRVKPGGVVQVYGILESASTMHADRTVIVNPDPSATAFKLGTSVIGLLLAAGYFLRHWRIDVRAFAFEPRTADSEPDADLTEGHQRG